MKDAEHHRIYREASARNALDSKLHKPEPVRPTEITYNPEAQAIEFEDHYGTVGRLLIREDTVLYEGEQLVLHPTPETPPSPLKRPRPRRSR